MENPFENALPLQKISPERVAEIREQLRASKEKDRDRQRAKYAKDYPDWSPEKIEENIGGDRAVMDIDMLSDGDVALWELLEAGVLTSAMVLQQRESGVQDTGRKEYFALLNNLIGIQSARRTMGKPDWQKIP